MININRLDTAPESLPWWRAMNDLTSGQDLSLNSLETNNNADYKQLIASLNGVLNLYADVNSAIGKIPYTETLVAEVSGFGATVLGSSVTIVSQEFIVPDGKRTVSVLASMDIMAGVTPSVFEDFDTYAADQGYTTFGDFDTAWSGQTFGDFDAIWVSTVNPQLDVIVSISSPDIGISRSIFGTVDTGSVASENISLTASLPNQASLATPFPTETNYLQPGQTIIVLYRVAVFTAGGPVPPSPLNIANCNTILTWS